MKALIVERDRSGYTSLSDRIFGAGRFSLTVSIAVTV